MAQQKAIIIGAGPAGLTAAYELLQRTGIMPVVLELSDYMGGIARTVNYKGNRIDIGGHRFFSKSDRVMNWWLQFVPMQSSASTGGVIAYQQKTRTLPALAVTRDPETEDLVMLLRQRKSRIYFLRRFFDYPIALSKNTLANLGVSRTVRIGLSYIKATLRPIRNESTLEEFFINRFGRELYRTFFEAYTEKVWGVPCNKISAEWGAQRIKGLSIRKALAHYLGAGRRRKNQDLSQKGVETSLIEQFLYPKLGPGQLWEEVARQVQALGGEILTRHKVERLEHDGSRLRAVTARNTATGEVRRFEGDWFVSTMPVQDLVRAMEPPAPPQVREVGDGLVYRDFITVGLLCRRLKVRDSAAAEGLIRDNWIYIQEPDVKVGRLQIFNNWSPYMVSDSSTVWVGLEYFCFEGDDLWNMRDEDLIRFGTEELSKIDIIEANEVLDGTVIRMAKTYPAYFGTYPEFHKIRDYVDGFENLYLVGRNGMHKYNNQDHSMLAAMTVVDNIVNHVRGKENIWLVNTEQEYHEEK